MMNDDGVAVAAGGLHKAYGQHQVLAGVDLTLQRGSVLALLGRNGAGKTTTVKILSTLLRADSGRVRVAGYDAVADRAQVRRRISVTGQYAALDELQTGEENLRVVGRLRGLGPAAARARASELLDGFDLADAGARRVSTYSGGMRRRLDLAMSLVGDPEVLFLDEPTTGLDLQGRQAVWDGVGALVAQGVSVLLTTQYLEEADRLADRIAVLDGGRVIADGTVAELKRSVADQRLELMLAGPDALARVTRALGDRLAGIDGARLRVSVPTDGSAAHVRAVLDELDPLGDDIARFAVHTATLDDVFLALTERDQETADV
jgi:ABC-2 type transport system ATP-binding protein